MTLMNACQKVAPQSVEVPVADASQERSGEERPEEEDEKNRKDAEEENRTAAGEAAVPGTMNAAETVPAAGREDTGQTEIREAAFAGSTVSVARSDRSRAEEITEEEIEDMVRFAASDLNTVVHNGQTVVIKPNLVQMIVDSTGELLDEEVNGITTDWRVTKAVVKMVRELNPDGKVYLMEGSATGPTRDVMSYFHYTPEYLEGVDGFICLEEDCGAWQDFDAPEVVEVSLPDGLLHQSYYFNRILYEADVIISVPVLKTTSGVVVTAGIKNVSIGTPPGNLYGAAYDNPSKVRMVSHKITDGDLDKWIYDYYRAKPVDYVIVDGLQGFQNGPVPASHESREQDKMNMRAILAGRDAVAVDTVCSLTVGWDPQSVGYLNLFRENMGLGEMEDIRIRGAYVDELRKDFAIRRPELGGAPVIAGQGPEVSAEAATDGNMLSIRYRAAEEASKIEVLVDGYFQYSEEAGAEGEIRLEIPGLAEGEHELAIIAYDRFLNKNVVKVFVAKKT